MTRVARTCLAWVVRGGRLLETSDGLLDLATGRSARMTCTPVTAPAAWVSPRRSTVGDQAAGRLVCVDAWLTQDWLGRWQQRSVWVPLGTAAETVAADHEVPDALPGDALGILRVSDASAWIALAAGLRAAGVLPVRVECMPLLAACAADLRMPLAVAVPDDAGLRRPSPALTHWIRDGGRVAWLVGLPAFAHAWPPPVAAVWQPSAPARPTDLARAARVRLLRRAWLALASAPRAAAVTWVSSAAGGRRVTHQELLDVSHQIEDARHDDEAMRLVCRAARQHTRAAHVALVAARGGGPVLLASDGAEGETCCAWPQLCLEDAPRELVSIDGCHAASAHLLEDGCVWMCARWPTQDAGRGATELLSVFARLAAPRVPARLAAVTTTPAGLEETLVGTSTVMQDVRAQIALAARAPFPVLIRGESGCGKELAARAIHALGPRRHRKVAALNCAALPDDLIESELFGHVRGAFTGAASDRAGLFDEADGGTLFLDEVGELGARAQAKLLRVLQDGEVRRVGDNHARRVDVRIIAATNVSLEDAVRRSAFRADLFYRLDVVRVRMPALRERREDIPVLARHFWRDCTARVGSRARLDGRVLEALARYDWPGNVRQLQNTLAALSVRVPPRGRVTVDDLPLEIRRPDAGVPYGVRGGLDAARREFEVSFVRDALSRAGGRAGMAARDLGLTRQGLSKLVRRLGLDEDAAGSRLP